MAGFLGEAGAFVKHYATPAERFHPLPPGIDRDRAVAPAGSDDAAYRRELGLGEAGRVLLFVGSGFVKKGLDRALTALAALPEPLASSMLARRLGRSAIAGAAGREGRRTLSKSASGSAMASEMALKRSSRSTASPTSCRPETLFPVRTPAASRRSMRP